MMQVMDVSQANCWKPGGAAYLYAAHRLALKPPEVRISVHLCSLVRVMVRHNRTQRAEVAHRSKMANLTPWTWLRCSEASVTAAGL